MLWLDLEKLDVKGRICYDWQDISLLGEKDGRNSINFVGERRLCFKPWAFFIVLRTLFRLNRVRSVYQRMKKLLTILAGLLSAFTMAFAQSGNTLTMTLTDATTGEPVGFATVSLTKPNATKPYKYALSDGEGKVSIDKISRGNYVLKAEIMGYKTYSQDVEISGSLNLGTVKLDQDRQTLDAASVSATGNPIVVKKDTIEYSASSFKTSENDMLEDLLKKLPGVEVSEDGTVTANGETISKITIDGKTFFLDDPQIASKNIPAKIIEKVKVVDKKSEQAEFTGIYDGEEETVIDLSIYKGMMDGWFGNLIAGAGHDVKEKATGTDLASDSGDWRYQAGGFLGNFKDKSQISIILNGNNTNNRGFNDLSGSMMSGMRGGGGGMGGGQGGWGGRNGITTSWMGGLNGVFNLFDDKMELGANYLYNNSSQYVEENSRQTTYLDNYNLIYNTSGASTTNSDGHRFGVRLDHKFSDNTSILFEPQFNFGKGDFTEFSEFSTLTETDGVTSNTNEGFTNTMGTNDNWTANGFLLLRQRLGKSGRTLSFNMYYNISDNETNGFNQSLTRTWDEFENPTDSIVNQRYDQTQNTNTINGRLTYTEPLGGGFFVEGSYQYSWNKTTSTKNTFDSGSVGNFDIDDHPYSYSGETPNSVYSSSIENRYINQRIGANLVYQNEKLNVQGGISANPTNTRNETTSGGVTQDPYESKVINWAPQAMLRYEINDNTSLRGFYFGRSSQPSVSQLMKVPDNTNPLSVSFGNMYLEPYFNHDIRLNFRHTNKETFFSINADLDGGIVKNPIVNAQWYGSNGVQYSIPVNGKDSYDVGLRLFINSPIAKSNFSVFNMTRVAFANSSSYVADSSIDMSPYYSDESYDATDFDADKFIEDFGTLGFTLNKLQTLSVTERLRLTYRNDFVELTAGARTRISKSWYTIASQSTDMTFSNQLNASMNWTLGTWAIVGDLDYNWYNGYTTEQDDEFILNAKITKNLGKKFVLALNAYDIFNQSKNLSISDSSNYHTETLNNTLGRYVVLTLTYKFGTFSGGNRRGMGGPMGGPPPGR